MTRTGGRGAARSVEGEIQRGRPGAVGFASGRATPGLPDKTWKARAAFNACRYGMFRSDPGSLEAAEFAQHLPALDDFHAFQLHELSLRPILFGDQDQYLRQMDHHARDGIDHCAGGAHQPFTNSTPARIQPTRSDRIVLHRRI
jgi:hypothetical protein